jgi:superfamily II DNA/RNA helicase
MNFSELGLSQKVLDAVTATGYTEPTPIQAQAIPEILARRDVLGIAQTGTGKTAAFTLPMMTLLEQGRARARMPRTLILEPTRELAAQVEESFNKYSVGQRLDVALLIGGVSFGDQDIKITRGVDVLIATPGRLLDHFERGKLLLTGIEILVIDEADRMLDMGFIPDIERICKLVPFTRQTLFFSATMAPEIQRLTETFLHNPVRIEVARQSTTASTITQRLIGSHSHAGAKRETLRRLIRDAEELKNGIIFCNRKTDVHIVYKSLTKHGFNVAALHGDMDQRSRMAALEGFRNGTTPLLVASDVAARGLDIPDVSHVFNYDVPHHAEDYVHRIGRTGRAGRKGTAYTIVTDADAKSLGAIEHLIKTKIEFDGPDLANLPPDETERRPDRAKPRERGRPRREHKPRMTEPRHGDAQAMDAPMMDAPGMNADQPVFEPAPMDDQPYERPARMPRPERGERDGRRERPRREDRRPRDRDDHEPTPKGLGDHVPSFMLRSVKLPPRPSLIDAEAETSPDAATDTEE